MRARSVPVADIRDVHAGTVLVDRDQLIQCCSFMIHDETIQLFAGSAEETQQCVVALTHVCTCMHACSSHSLDSLRHLFAVV